MKLEIHAMRSVFEIDINNNDDKNKVLLLLALWGIFHNITFQNVL